VVLALVPQVAAWGKLMIDNSLGAAGTNAAAVGLDKLGQVGVLYHGLEVLGSGAILVSLIFAAVAACMIDGAFKKAAAFALAGAILTFFGFMHSEAIGIGKTPLVAISYLGVAVLLAACAKYGATASKPAAVPDDRHEPRAFA
jgi:AGZA family xanthine/uracil permease-like MFS transporter